MKKVYVLEILLLGFCLIFAQCVVAESISFGDFLYIRKDDSNQYYKKSETPDSWTSRIETLYYPEVENPLKYASEQDKIIENDDKCVLLKFIQNKKQGIAIISYLENSIERDGKVFTHNICKYEKHPVKGIVMIRYAKKYYFNTDEEITNIGHEIRRINNDYMEQMIITDSNIFP
jgi:hypothetical protein